MPYYRTKQVVVEAHEYTGSNEEFLATWSNGKVRSAAPFPSNDPNRSVEVETDKGVMRGSIGDVIIRDNGEFYPVKPDIFAETYEPATRQAYDRPQGGPVPPEI